MLSKVLLKLVSEATRSSLERGFVCIPKSVKEQQIIENGDVFDFKISDEDMHM